MRLGIFTIFDTFCLARHYFLVLLTPRHFLAVNRVILLKQLEPCVLCNVTKSWFIKTILTHICHSFISRRFLSISLQWFVSISSHFIRETVQYASFGTTRIAEQPSIQENGCILQKCLHSPKVQWHNPTIIINRLFIKTRKEHWHSFVLTFLKGMGKFLKSISGTLKNWSEIGEETKRADFPGKPNKLLWDNLVYRERIRYQGTKVLIIQIS